MTEVSSGSAPYIYVSTRMRVRKAKLIRKEEYARMLNMGLPELTRIMEEMEYKREIDELATSYSGVDLIENALSWNLSKEYQRVIKLAPGEMKGFTRDYLQKWDIYNVLTILRGKQLGLSAKKIQAVLVPAGALDAAALDRMIAEQSIDKIVDTIPDKKFSEIIRERLNAALESRSFSDIENELYKHYFAMLLANSRGGVKGGASFKKFVLFVIDAKNIGTLFRLRSDKDTSSDTHSVWIDGGSYKPEELEHLKSVEALGEVVDSLKKKTKFKAMMDQLDQLREEKLVYEVAGMVQQAILDRMDRMSRREPFSISPLLVYLERKNSEVSNLRVLARGKQAGLPSETLEKYLVI